MFLLDIHLIVNSLKYSDSGECQYLGEFSYWFGLILVWTSILIGIIVWTCTCFECVNKEFSQNLFNVAISV